MFEKPEDKEIIRALNAIFWKRKPEGFSYEEFAEEIAVTTGAEMSIGTLFDAMKERFASERTMGILQSYLEKCPGKTEDCGVGNE